LQKGRRKKETSGTERANLTLERGRASRRGDIQNSPPTTRKRVLYGTRKIQSGPTIRFRERKKKELGREALKMKL